MTEMIRARYRNGKIEPMEKLDLPDDTEILISIDTPAAKDKGSRGEAAGSWKGSKPEADVLIRRLRAARRAGTRPEQRP